MGGGARSRHRTSRGAHHIAYCVPVSDSLAGAFLQAWRKRRPKRGDLSWDHSPRTKDDGLSRPLPRNGQNALRVLHKGPSKLHSSELALSGDSSWRAHMSQRMLQVEMCARISNRAVTPVPIEGSSSYQISPKSRKGIKPLIYAPPKGCKGTIRHSFD